LLVASGPDSLVRNHHIQLDARALFFTAAIVLASAVGAGLPPAWRVLRVEIGHALREAGRGLTAGHHGFRSALVAGQVALALVLLVGSGLLIRSFQRLLEVNPGFDPHNLVTISTQVPAGARTPEQRTSVYRTMRDRLVEIPGVANVAAVSRLPLLGRSLGSWVFVEGKSMPGAPTADIEYRVATPSYFPTMGIPLRAGRLYDDHDDANAAGVLLINETTARRFWPGENPIGKRVKLGANPDRQPWITVIGVVGDIRHVGLDTEPRPEIYRPYGVNPLGAPILVVRTRADAAPMVNSLGAAVRSVSPEVPAYDVFLMEGLVDRSTRERRFVMMLLSAYAFSALLLAGVGIYGTVSQSVLQRTREIGLRMALGALPGTVLQMVFAQGLRLVAVGIGAGSLAAAALTWLMRSILFEVRPLDPLAFAAAALTLGAFALLACYLPARRATRVDPLIALRHDG
jgi:putative ABC transport system permease protein